MINNWIESNIILIKPYHCHWHVLVVNDVFFQLNIFIFNFNNLISIHRKLKTSFGHSGCGRDTSWRDFFCGYIRLPLRSISESIYHKVWRTENRPHLQDNTYIPQVTQDSVAQGYPIRQGRQAALNHVLRGNKHVGNWFAWTVMKRSRFRSCLTCSTKERSSSACTVVALSAWSVVLQTRWKKRNS